MLMKTLTILLAFMPVVSAQFYNISTVAGVGRPQFAGSTALTAQLIQPNGVAVDTAGNIYLADSFYEQVLRITPNGGISVFAGNGQLGFSGDGGPAIAAALSYPTAVAVDSNGNVYIADTNNQRVRKVSPGGAITTVAGNGQSDVTGDGAKATSAAVGNPFGLAVDGSNNLYISQRDFNVIRMVNAAGIITTVAGNGRAGFSGDGGVATSAALNFPQGLKVDTKGNVYVADSRNQRVRKFTPGGIITTAAGNGNLASSGNGGQATAAALAAPVDVAIDSAGNLYIATFTDSSIRAVNSSGIISTFAGGAGSLPDGPAHQTYFDGPGAIAVDSQGNIIVTEYASHRVRRVAQQTVTTIAGSLPAPAGGDNIQATSSPLFDPYGIAVDSLGDVYIGDALDNRIRKVSSAGIITTVAGGRLDEYTGDNGPATSAQIGNPFGISVDSANNIYVSQGFGIVVRRIASSGTITTVAGGAIGLSGDGGPATAAALNYALDAVADAGGNLYISDINNNRIRRVDSTGTITTFAGTGEAAFGGDNGPARSAQLYGPQQLALDRGGNLYVADRFNCRIRKITPSGTITTVAGNGFGGLTGDGGLATDAQIGFPTGVAVDSSGNLFIATKQYSGGTTLGRIRKVDATSGIISTIAGTGTAGFGGDGGLATLATLNAPSNIAVDNSGNVFFTDENNLRVRKLTPVQIVKEGVTNGATFKTGGVAPGEIITIYGSNLGPATGVGLQLDASGKVATQLGGKRVMFDSVAAPRIFVSATQINAVVPYEVAGESSTQLQVVLQGKPTNTVTLPVVPSSPGVFAITNQDGSVNTPSNPAAAGSAIVLYGTGEGQTSPAGIDGTVNTTVFPKPNLSVTVRIGGQIANILYAGAAPEFIAGVLQVNVQIPSGLPDGTVPLEVQIGDAVTPAGLTVSVRSQ